MKQRIALDTSAAVDLLRQDRPNPPIEVSDDVVLPIPVVGELFAGAFFSDQPDENLAKVDYITRLWSVLVPTLRSARIYGQLRARVGDTVGGSKRNDLWIAAICIDAGVPLLTNDRGFKAIRELAVIPF